METVVDGFEEVQRLMQCAKTVILALGCHPMVNAKEEIDRTTLALPPHQEKLAKMICKIKPVLFAFYSPIIRTRFILYRIRFQRLYGARQEARIWEQQWLRHYMVKMHQLGD